MDMDEIRFLEEDRKNTIDRFYPYHEEIERLFGVPVYEESKQRLVFIRLLKCLRRSLKSPHRLNSYGDSANLSASPSSDLGSLLNSPDSIFNHTRSPFDYSRRPSSEQDPFDTSTNFLYLPESALNLPDTFWSQRISPISKNFTHYGHFSSFRPEAELPWDFLAGINGELNNDEFLPTYSPFGAESNNFPTPSELLRQFGLSDEPKEKKPCEEIPNVFRLSDEPFVKKPMEEMPNVFTDEKNIPGCTCKCAEHSEHRRNTAKMLGADKLRMPSLSFSDVLSLSLPESPMSSRQDIKLTPKNSTCSMPSFNTACAFPSAARIKKTEPKKCKFCKKNGEMPEVYTGHGTKDVCGIVTCPILRRYVCDLCGATGDKAHTRKYCLKYTGHAKTLPAYRRLDKKKINKFCFGIVCVNTK